MLSKKEWIKACVVKWEQIEMPESSIIKRGWLYLREPGDDPANDDTVTGHAAPRCGTEAKSIDYYYDIYTAELRSLGDRKLAAAA